MRWQIEDTPERAAARAEFRSWLNQTLPAGWLAAVDADDNGEAMTAVRAQWDLGSWQRTIGASGYGAPLWPTEYGGRSGQPWLQQIVREELTRYRLPSVSINILGLGLAGPTLIEHGTPEQKSRYLAKILTAEEIWCQLFSEPGSGSDLASLSTRAVRDGNEWVVNGQKVWTSLAQASSFGMLLARTNPDAPKHDGLTYFIVDMKAPGVEIRPLVQITGSAEFNEVFFTDVRIPDENRVGAAGDGWRCARTTLMNERVTLSGISLDRVAFLGGAHKDPWPTFLETVPERSSALIRDRLAQLYIEQEVKEVTAFRAASARAAGRQPGPEGSVGKVFNAEFNQRRTEAAVDAAGLGGVAWMPGDDLAQGRAHNFLRARANTIEGGTSEVLRSQIAERMLGLPREPDLDKGAPWSKTRR